MCDVRCVGFINEKKSEKNNRFTFEKKLSWGLYDLKKIPT
jgi:hypothetical protein